MSGKIAVISKNAQNWLEFRERIQSTSINTDHLINVLPKIFIKLERAIAKQQKISGRDRCAAVQAFFMAENVTSDCTTCSAQINGHCFSTDITFLSRINILRE